MYLLIVDTPSFNGPAIVTTAISVPGIVTHCSSDPMIKVTMQRLHGGGHSRHSPTVSTFSIFYQRELGRSQFSQSSRNITKNGAGKFYEVSPGINRMVARTDLDTS